MPIHVGATTEPPEGGTTSEDWNITHSASR
jgi:hypothetical protein